MPSSNDDDVGIDADREAGEFFRCVVLGLARKLLLAHDANRDIMDGFERVEASNSASSWTK